MALYTVSDQFTKFVLQLISGGLAEVGLDGDELTKRRVRVLRKIDTAFPLVVSDVIKKKVETDPCGTSGSPGTLNTTFRIQ